MTTTPVGSPTFPGSDINGDGHVDIFWRHTTAGQTSLWNMENETLAGGKLLLTVPTFWNLAGAADFTGDGVTDLLWRNNNTSMVALWEMNLQGDYVRSIPIRQLPLDWQPVGVGDFNNDGKSDILWSHRTVGSLVVWYMDGPTLMGGEEIARRPTEWQVGAAADFTRDGKDDLVWVNQTTGRVEIWQMDGKNQVGTPFFVNTINPVWQLRGSGDLNNNGQNDLVWWRPDTGRTVLWDMNGTNFVGGRVLADVNPAWRPLVQARGGLPDLTVQNITGIPTTLTDGETANLSFRVANQGTRTAGASTFKYYLSNDTTLDLATDAELGTISVGALRAGQSADFSRLFTYNASTMGDSGTKYLFFVADTAGVVSESREDNNIFRRSFEATSAAPRDVDLVLQNPVLPDTWIAGRPVDLTVTIANSGNESAGASTLSIYILDTPTFTPGNRQPVFSNRIEALGGGLSITRNYTFDYLESFGDGQKYLFFVVDSANEVGETNEGNNITQFPISVAPAINVDFTITNVTVPPTITIGQPMTVSVTVQNQGTTVSSPTTLSIYTSNLTGPNDVFDPNTARIVTSAPIAILNPNQSNTLNLTFTYSSLFGEGFQNLFFVVDVDNDVEETNETNNIAKEVLEATPPQNIDLVILNPTISNSTVLPGNTVTISAQVQNLGSVGAGENTLRLYLSTDTTFDASDSLISGRALTSVAPNSSSAVQSFDYTYPPNGAPGTYYVLLVADATGTVFETNETNNVSFVQFTVPAVQPGIDLLVSNATTSSGSVTVGEQLTINATVQNQGQNASGTSRLGFYLSDDNIFNPATDRLLTTREIASLNTFGTSAPQSYSFTYLDEYGIGNKFILVVADDNGLVTESNEANNVQAIALSALPDPNRPDLVVADAQFQMTSSMDGITVRYFINNLGPRPTTSGTITTAFYLSNTPITTLSGLSNAVLLNTETLNADIAADGGELTSILTLEPGANPNPIWSPGQKYLIVVADSNNGVLERDETNNVSSFAITLS